MPCYSQGPSNDYYDELKAERRNTEWLEAALCATLGALENLMKEKGVVHPYEVIDYKEAGIKREALVDWHTKHKAKDAARRAREAALRKANAEKARKAKARKALIAKLTPEERELLGVKE